LNSVDLRFVSSGKNDAVVDFLRTAAAVSEQRQEGGSIFSIPAETAANVRYRAADRHPAVVGTPSAAAGSPPPVTTRDARAEAALLTSIAQDLSDPREISEQIAARRRARPDTTAQYVAPRTPFEKTITGIFAAVLGLDRVGVEDNFFQIGGHSLLAMQVLFKIRAAFQVELSPRLLYSSLFTAADLATKVLEAQLATADPQLTASLLQRLNTLTDDEVRILLEQKSGTAPPPAAGRWDFT
jgi:acyl carrier protein